MGSEGHPARYRACGKCPFVKAIEANSTLDGEVTKECVLGSATKHLEFYGDTSSGNRYIAN